jgi:hypothetical protein
MGVFDDIAGSGVSGVYLGITIVLAVATYGLLRGSGLPLLGSPNGGTIDPFGGG